MLDIYKCFTSTHTSRVFNSNWPWLSFKRFCFRLFFFFFFVISTLKFFAFNLLTFFLLFYFIHSTFSLAPLTWSTSEHKLKEKSFYSHSSIQSGIQFSLVSPLSSSLVGFLFDEKVWRLYWDASHVKQRKDFDWLCDFLFFVWKLCFEYFELTIR